MLNSRNRSLWEDERERLMVKTALSLVSAARLLQQSTLQNLRSYVMILKQVVVQVIGMEEMIVKRCNSRHYNLQ